jgi:fucose permease
MRDMTVSFCHNSLSRKLCYIGYIESESTSLFSVFHFMTRVQSTFWKLTVSVETTPFSDAVFVFSAEYLSYMAADLIRGILGKRCSTGDSVTANYCCLCESQ